MRKSASYTDVTRCIGVEVLMYISAVSPVLREIPVRSSLQLSL